jgi:tRNA modification GTPase
LLPVRLLDRSSGERLDQGMAVFFAEPKSYTGENMAEVHGHGGVLNIERLLRQVLEMGARLAEPGEFTRRAFLNGKLDLIQAEAVAEIIGAQCDRALANAQRLLAGRLGHAIGAVRDLAVELAADLEAVLDFAEDLGAIPDPSTVQAKCRSLLEELQRLGAACDRGQRLHGLTVGLLGRVNAGKSSLFNALLDRPRALVSPEAGTTRDYLECDVQWEGYRVTLIDTAGERACLTGVERDGLKLATERLSRADVLVRVLDLGDCRDAIGSAAEDTAAGRCVAAPAGERREVVAPQVVVANKVDLLLPEEVQPRCATLGSEGCVVVPTSATTRQGIEELKRAILRAGYPAETSEPGRTEDVFVTEQRQEQHLTLARVEAAACARALTEGFPVEVSLEHLRQVLGALDAIVGRRFGEDVLSSIFSRFCVGK